MRRNRYQFGTIELDERKNGPAVWRYRYSERTPEGIVRRSVELGTADKLTQKQAYSAAEAHRIKANPDNYYNRVITWNGLLDRYLQDELPTRHSTAKGYRNWIKGYIRPKWGEYAVADVKPFAVETWMKALPLLPKSKQHIKTVMMVVYSCAQRWEIVDASGQNPFRLVRVPGCSKRKKKPFTLTVTQIQAIIDNVTVEPFKTVIWVAACLGLRGCEWSGLKWCDFNFEAETVSIRRGVVEGREGAVKTVYSEANLPLAPELAKILVAWKLRTPWNSPDDWVFASPSHKGKTPYWPKSAQKYLVDAAKLAGIALPDRQKWHIFRHSYSTLLRAFGVDIKVQQELLRHADIRTTMDVYTQGVPEKLREANSRIVGALIN